jgi:hypothetical protein
MSKTYSARIFSTVDNQAHQKYPDYRRTIAELRYAYHPIRTAQKIWRE